MSTSTDKKDVSGRSWDQITKNGTSSAGSMGVGGTGDSGKLDQGDTSQQSATRTDDLLDDGSAMEGDQQGYAGKMGGQVQTGMEGIGKGAGNRQSAGQPGGPASPESGRDEGNAGRGDGNR